MFLWVEPILNVKHNFQAANLIFNCISTHALRLRFSFVLLVGLAPSAIFSQVLINSCLAQCLRPTITGSKLKELIKLLPAYTLLVCTINEMNSYRFQDFTCYTAFLQLMEYKQRAYTENQAVDSYLISTQLLIILL